MSTPTPETLRALAKRLRQTFDPGGSLDPDGPDEWVVDHLLALDELAALLDTQEPPAIRCPACDEIVRQVSSATLDIALSQHYRWVCSKKPEPALLDTAPPAVETGEWHGWLVLRKRETDPWEVYPFERYDEAAMFFDAAQAQWSETYLCRVAFGPGTPRATPMPYRVVPLTAPPALTRERILTLPRTSVLVTGPINVRVEMVRLDDVLRALGDE